MSKVIGTATENDLLSWLDEQVNTREPYDPDRHITYWGLNKRYGLTRSQARTLLERLLSDGEIEKLDDEVTLPNGRPGVAYVRKV